MGKKHSTSKDHAAFIQPDRRSYIAAASVAVLGLLASIAVFSVVSQREHNVLETEFELRVRGKTAAIQREVDIAVAVVESVAALYMASNEVTPEEFDVFTKPLLKRHKLMRAMGYCPLLVDSERDAFEQTMRTMGYPNYTITELSLGGAMVPAQRRHEYVPVARIEPLAGNKAALGYDIASEPIRKEAILRAIIQKKPAATGPISLVQDTTTHGGFLIMIPITKNGMNQTEVNALAVGVFNIRDLVNQAMSRIQDLGIRYTLYETGPNAEAINIYQSQAKVDRKEPEDRAVLSAEKNVRVAGRVWTLKAWSTPSFKATFLTHTPWNVMCCGLLFTAVVSIHLLRLNHLNTQLAGSEEKFKLLAENINSVFWIMSPDALTIHYLSPGFKNLFGIDLAEVYEKPRLFLKAIHPEDQSKVTRAIRGLSYGLDFHEEWRIIRRPDGEVRWIFNHGFPVIHEDGIVHHIVGISSDITQQRKTQQELEQLQRDAGQSDA